MLQSCLAPASVPRDAGAQSRPPHRTGGALVHGLADLWLTKLSGSRAGGRSMEAAQTTGVAECGKGDSQNDHSVALSPRCQRSTCDVGRALEVVRAGGEVRRQLQRLVAAPSWSHDPEEALDLASDDDVPDVGRE